MIEFHKKSFNMEMKEKIQEKFRTLFGQDGAIFASAGRVNLIGEHSGPCSDRTVPFSHRPDA